MGIGILGKKIGMTQIYDDKGKLLPVTAIEAGPCYVLKIMTRESDGYDAIQLGFDDKRKKLTNKPDLGRFKKAGVDPKKFVKELKVRDPGGYKVGQKIEADMFDQGDFVDVTGISSGKGFQGGMKRWGWSGGDAGHGSMFHRRPGSIQSGPRLKRITKGKHMPGHMGARTITVQNLEVLKVDKDNNILVVKGPIPGHKNAYLIVREARKIPKKPKDKDAKEAPEEKAKEKKAK